MMTDADLLKGLKDAWDTDPLLATLCPGGIHFNRADKDTTAPYVVLAIRPLDPDFTTEEVTLLPYLVSLAVYGETGAYDTKPIAEQLEDRFGTEVEPDNARCIYVLKAAGEFKHDEARRDQDDVVKLTLAWKMLFSTPR